MLNNIVGSQTHSTFLTICSEKVFAVLSSRTATPSNFFKLLNAAVQNSEPISGFFPREEAKAILPLASGTKSRKNVKSLLVILGSQTISLPTKKIS